jgi:hypothetical protein
MVRAYAALFLAFWFFVPLVAPVLYYSSACS